MIQIGIKSIGEGCPCFVIAEAGVNHNGKVELAKELIDAAVKAGADAVKFQTFKTDKLVTRNAPKAEYQNQQSQNVVSQYEMLKGLELTQKDHLVLREYCDSKNILFLSTPFDIPSVDVLNSINVPAFKISSGEITNLPLLKYVASFGKPVILSTGMATLDEVRIAIEAVKSAGNSKMILLQCISRYPCDDQDCNLRVMHAYRKEFGVEVGYSDHTVGIEIPLAAVAMGACVIEKHFTISRKLPGPDHFMSLEPEELQKMVQGIRRVEKALGNGIKIPTKGEEDVANVARKSLVAARNIPAGTRITSEMIDLKRPGTGLSPNKIECLIGRVAKLSIPEGHLFTLEDVK